MEFYIININVIKNFLSDFFWKFNEINPVSRELKIYVGNNKEYRYYIIKQIKNDVKCEKIILRKY